MLPFVQKRRNIDIVFLFLTSLLAKAAEMKGYTINHESASKMLGVSAIFVPSRIFFFSLKCYRCKRFCMQ